LGAVLFLPYLPMLPIQILFNNFLYDFSQVTIPTDNVDAEFTAQPKKWDMNFIKKFMFIFGPISSVYDYLTYILMYFVFKAPANVFHTAWFMESLATQTFVIYVIRTRKLPFIQSSPSRPLFISTLLCVAAGWIIPFTFLGRYLGFVALPLNVIMCLVTLVILYLVCVEVGKRLFYRRYRI
jgi:P-type Mg2+ transporter